ncbi:PaaI family thioesterase [Modestobacter versicolor]|uniref:PaaI family thioesterase n=1 Tax=Modestobacter versicolor TaxID=429133 RepID=UPI0034DF25B8
MADAPDDDSTPVDPALFRALAADPLAAHLGIELTDVRPGYARATMTVGPQLLNAVGTAHGGATMALLDVVHGAVSNSHGTVAVAQDVHTEFLSPGRPGDQLVAEGVELHRTSRTAVYRIDATTTDGRRVATALARVFRLGTPWGATGTSGATA